MINPILLSSISSFLTRYRIPILLFFLAVFILPEVACYFNHPARGGDMHTYVQAGLDLLAKKNLYEFSSPSVGNTWPPFYSLFIVPLSLSSKIFGMPIAKEIWYFFTFACLVLTVIFFSSDLIGKNVSFISRTGTLDFSSPKIFTPLLIILPALVNNFFNLQVNPLVLLSLVTGYYMYRKDRTILSGLAFGFAAALKAYPGFFLVYFLMRRQWKLSMWIVIFASLFTISPALIYGPSEFIALFTHWLTMSLLSKLTVGCGIFSNQSLYAIWTYYLSCRFDIVPLGDPLIKIGSYFTMLVMFAGVMIVILRKPFNRHSFSFPIEFAIMCLLMTIFSPIAWRHYWINAYPGAVIAFSLWKMPNKVYKYLLLLFLVFMFSSYITPDLIRKWALSFGSYTFSAITLIVLLLFALKNAPLIKKDAVP